MKQVTNNDIYKALDDINNIKIMNKVVNIYYRYLSKDEAESCKLNGLWKALGCHDNEKGSKFTSSLYRYVKWECQSTLREKYKFVYYSIDCDIEESNRKIFNDVDISEYFQTLSNTDKKIMQMRFIDSLSLEAIGKTFHISRQAVKQRIDKSIKLISPRCNQ